MRKKNPSPFTTSPVPPPKKNVFWVETVNAGPVIKFRVYSPNIWGIWTHYKGRTVPCFKNHDFCQGGHDETNLRWYGYLFGWHETENRPAFLQVTTGAARQLLTQVAPGVSLQGVYMEVWRKGSKRGPMYTKINQWMPYRGDKKPEDADPHDSLFRMWKVKHVGHAANLSLVTSPADIPEDGEILNVS